MARKNQTNSNEATTNNEATTTPAATNDATSPPATDAKTPAKKRIYLVHKDGEPLMFVRARSVGAATLYAAGKQFETILADGDHFIKHMGKLPMEEAAAAE
jgi:hypothetical protein